MLYIYSFCRINISESESESESKLKCLLFCKTFGSCCLDLCLQNLNKLGLAALNVLRNVIVSIVSCLLKTAGNAVGRLAKHLWALVGSALLIA